MIESIKSFVEGRGSMASLERAIEEADNPLQARAEVERELAAECTLKNLFATIPPPKVGLSGVLKALRAMPDPENSIETAQALKAIGEPLRKSMQGIPAPAGGFKAAFSRLKLKLDTAPAPARRAESESDIKPGFDLQSSESPAAGTHTPRLVERRKPRRSTQKVVPLQRHSAKWRDVLAAGKDLPEDPNDIPDA